MIFAGKMFEKHLCESDILSKDAGLEYHRPASICGTLVKNGLIQLEISLS